MTLRRFWLDYIRAVHRLAPESEGIEVGILKAHSEPNRLPLQGGHIGAIPPPDDAFDRYCQVKWNSRVLEAKSLVSRT